MSKRNHFYFGIVSKNLQRVIVGLFEKDDDQRFPKRHQRQPHRVNPQNTAHPTLREVERNENSYSCVTVALDPLFPSTHFTVSLRCGPIGLNRMHRFHCVLLGFLRWFILEKGEDHVSAIGPHVNIQRRRSTTMVVLWDAFLLEHVVGIIVRRNNNDEQATTT